MKYQVIVEQKIEYTEKIVAEFATIDEAALYCKVTLEACKNTTVEIIRIEEETTVEKNN